MTAKRDVFVNATHLNEQIGARLESIHSDLWRFINLTLPRIAGYSWCPEDIKEDFRMIQRDFPDNLRKIEQIQEYLERRGRAEKLTNCLRQDPHRIVSLRVIRGGACPQEN
jgi:hypothetical protein